MNHQRRVSLYRQYMAASGADPNTAAPYLWQLAWARGWKIPPPPFMSGLALALFAAVAYPALAFFLWLLTFVYPNHRVPFVFAAWVAASAGVFGVVATPIYFHHMAKQYGLVHWSTFAGVRQRT
ncbi:DUF6404 family protein [Cognatilysobacter lacus]|uniref:Uncharacterized protein n=1 Tax=Cognatilysobacter lacus TaxID=1643323 RepID=A0A5D8YL63_9GAMM|nr:DUF6404 family protein [Lysobacter lacus]TZF83515.1 hypothetical protein FW784_12905 [Lysobacter lacus]